MPKMKIKKNDTVIILSGDDKGKTGVVKQALPKESKVVVEGINIIKKHSKPNNQNDKGGIFDIEAPIHVSNVKVVEAAKKETKKAVKKEEVKEAKAPAKKAPAKKTASKKASK
jgi:large subunit ribosomal protein L24